MIVVVTSVGLMFGLRFRSGCDYGDVCKFWFGRGFGIWCVGLIRWLFRGLYWLWVFDRFVVGRLTALL